MTRTFREGDFELSFDESWSSVIKWDEENAYRDGIHRLPSSRAVDFCGLRGDGLVLLELKDFRGARIENKPRLLGDDLHQEVATKVRDTLAGLIGAARMRQTEESLYRPLAGAAVAYEWPLRVILWIGEDRDRRPSAADLNARTNRLKQLLRWLTARVQVDDIDGAGASRLGIRVRRVQRPAR